jgi:hypothetical protein
MVNTLDSASWFLSSQALTFTLTLPYQLSLSGPVSASTPMYWPSSRETATMPSWSSCSTLMVSFPSSVKSSRT